MLTKRLKHKVSWMWLAAVAFTVALLCVTSVVNQAHAFDDTSIVIVPPSPTTSDNISIQLSGKLWHDDCIPNFQNVVITTSNTAVDIYTANSAAICSQILTSWSLTVPIGQLPPGVYTVNIFYNVKSVPGPFATGFFTVAATPSILVHLTDPGENGPIGIVANTNTMLYTQYCLAKPFDAAIFSVAPFGSGFPGSIVPFAESVFPSKAGCLEKYLDINPGLVPWGSKAGWVYVTQGTEIYEIDPGGSTASLFATIAPSSLVVDHTGITFDRTGAFGNDMIVTAPNGEIFRITPAGGLGISSFANVGTFHENPEVIPASFGPLGGRVWTAAETVDKVFAIAPSGLVNVVGTSTTFFDSAETVSLIPKNFGVFGNSDGHFFVTSHGTSDIVKFPLSDFTQFGGDVLIAGEGGQISRISVVNNAYVFSTFDSTLRHHEGATFVRKNPQRVGGITSFVFNGSNPPAQLTGDSRQPGGSIAILVGGLAAAVVVLGTGTWYSRRRWLGKRS